jgi:hypothetical protein
LYSDAYAMAVEVHAPRSRIVSNIVRDVYPTDSGEGVGILLGAESTGSAVLDNVIVNSRQPAAGRTFGIWAAGQEVEVANNIIVATSYGIAGTKGTGNTLIDVPCIDDVDDPGARHVRTGKPLTCPDDYAVAGTNTDPHDRNAMFRLAQIHHRAGIAMLTAAYFRLAAQAGSSEAQEEAERLHHFGYLSAGELADSAKIAEILKRYHERVQRTPVFPTAPASSPDATRSNRVLSAIRGLLGRATPEPVTEEPIERLFAAVTASDLHGIRQAVADGAPVNIRRHGCTPLFIAASGGLNDAARTLLILGADPRITTDDNVIPFDCARHQGNIALEHMLTAAERGEILAEQLDHSSKCGCGTCRDLATFLDHADLVLPQAGWAFYRDRMRREIGEEAAVKAEQELYRTGYRSLYEQLYGGEALGCAIPMGGNFATIRSPMSLGSYELDYTARRKISLTELLAGDFEAADALFSRLIPDDYFDAPPKTACEIGGAWGGAIMHFMKRFPIETYHNYEPDRHYAEWAVKEYGAEKMPVDGETLRGTADDSMDLVMANSSFIIIPTMKIWSYLLEMRRVVRKGGIVAFNAIVSDQVSEEYFRNYLNGYFPRRVFPLVPRDVIDRSFPEPQFKLLAIDRKEYFVFKRVA